MPEQPSPDAVAQMAAWLRRIAQQYRPASERAAASQPDALPTPPVAPGIFQPDPMLVGSTPLQQLARRVLDATPEVKARLSQVLAAPDLGARGELASSGYEAQDYPDVTLYGTASPFRAPTGQQVSLNPGLDDADQGAVLMHELAHVAGADDEPDQRANNAEDLWNALTGRDVMPVKYREARVLTRPLLR